MPRFLSASALNAIKQRSMVALETLEIAEDPPFKVFTLHFVHNLVGLRIGDQDFMPLGFKRQAIETQSDFQVDRTGLEIDDVLGYFAKAAQGKTVTGMRARIRKIFVPDTVKIDDGILLFDGFFGTPNFTEATVSVELRSVLAYRDTDLPHRTYQPNCNAYLGDKWCKVDMTLPANRRQAVPQTGSHRRLLVVPTLDQQENYWIAGYVVLESGPHKGQVRPIKSSKPGYIKMEVPFEGDPTGYEVRVVRGCRKDKIDCVNRFDNLIHYAGFAEVPKTPAIDRVVSVETTGGSGK